MRIKNGRAGYLRFVTRRPVHSIPHPPSPIPHPQSPRSYCNSSLSIVFSFYPCLAGLIDELLKDLACAPSTWINCRQTAQARLFSAKSQAYTSQFAVDYRAKSSKIYEFITYRLNKPNRIARGKIYDDVSKKGLNSNSK